MGGLFGGGASLDTSGGDSYVSTLKKLGGQYGNLFDQSQGQYQGDDAAARRATTAYSQFLQRMPGTSTQDAQFMAAAEGNAAAGGQREDANLDQVLAQRGIAQNSSAGVGGHADIARGLAENHQNIANLNAIRNQDLYRRNLGENANLLSGQAGNDWAKAFQAGGQEAGIESGLLNDARSMEALKYQQEMQKQQAFAAMLGELGSAGINAWGSSARGGGKK